MRPGFAVAVLATLLLSSLTSALRYDPEYVRYNLNQNETATHPLDYWGVWEGHTYNPSPDNWRFPFYTLFLDRFVNGDPTNDNINGTAFEHDLNSNQIRHGGDAEGLMDSLDYIQGMGVKGIYLAGVILINQPWGADGYSPIDLTLLDAHYGDIETWRRVIQEIHRRGMYVVMDNTLATMSDLIGFQGYLNETAPFTMKEHKVLWKSDRRYPDFDIGNEYNETCDYPRFWMEDGYPVGPDVTSQMKGCYDSEFDQYGDTEAFGVYPDWRRQLTKFASVQDRLREWVPSVREKIQHSYCLMITMLDIDGFRYDKATQSTVDAMAGMSEYYRECARSVGKKNFFIAGEITGGDTFGSIYIGRGRQPNMRPESLLEAITMTNQSSEQYFLRPRGGAAVDAGAFHYSVYRSLTRFLGMDGNLAAGYDVPLEWVTAWNHMLLSNDFVNSNTGKLDPRHMYGVTNQDVFRWPAIANGTERMLLGMFVTTLLMPGIPKLIWGEEQEFYLLDSTASNYIFGRQAMSPATAWQTHGCYHMKSTQYFEFPIERARNGCHDDTQGLDHRDPSHPVRNIIKSMYLMRENYPSLNDGFLLELLSNQTREVFYPGSNGTATETGMWSVARGHFDVIQDLSGTGKGNQSVWLVYQNDNSTVEYEFDCSSNETALISPFDEGFTVKNLFYPHDEKTLRTGPKNSRTGSGKSNGCLEMLSLGPWEFRAYVPKEEFVAPRPMVTKFVPGHDAPLLSTVGKDESETVNIEIHFSAEMDCDAVTRSITLNSTTESGSIPQLSNAQCSTISQDTRRLTGEIASAWRYTAELRDVSNGVHRLTVRNASSADNEFTNAVDHFLFRIGQPANPMVFTRSANYSTSLLYRNKSDDSLYLSHNAAGADKFRYSLNWGSSFSDWLPYNGGNETIAPQEWSGTKLQEWTGEHVIVEYWSRLTGSSSYVQHGDLDHKGPSRRFPHLFWNGPYNQYGYDAGLENHFHLEGDGRWQKRFMTEWPAIAQVNVWGMNPDGKPDQTFVLGDIDGDSVLDRLPPSSLHDTLVNITTHPPRPYLAWMIEINDGTLRFELHPTGSETYQLVLYILLWIIPVLTGAISVWVFVQSFYKVKFNQTGVTEKRSFIPLAVRQKLLRKRDSNDTLTAAPLVKLVNLSGLFRSAEASVVGETSRRRTVLIATMEYDIEDWAIKIKIGGLGVMAQLMGKHLGHQDLIWVVPCVGGVEYPADQPADPINVTILGSSYEVSVQYHVLRNITYVLLDAPVFRRQTKSEPYPARMDDLDSAIYYSAWNQCVAAVIKRFPIDLYHINDYHGSIAPLYLLPQMTVPVCLSLHNAEFQGLWPMRTAKEREEVCSVFNIGHDIVKRYVQFGDVFNLLHAAASYLRIHQQGFGAVGVSKKYGVRSYLRYPIFWGLKKVGNLPNPDPSDTGALNINEKGSTQREPEVDVAFETSRRELRRQAQEWAGLNQDPTADLCVFVGRWSMQKGIDLIADVFPSILDRHQNVQLICIGPVIDLYGKFAAIKLAKLMDLYPGRVFSRPEFTALPPYIFSGAEFALIPSRDEPFGLVAVEFGRKGALGIGARVGGLGQMPGWWFTIESMTTSHLLHQFRSAIETALETKRDVRAVMRARSAEQRFPVAQWVGDLEILQSTAIRIHHREMSRRDTLLPSGLNTPTGFMTPPIMSPGQMTPVPHGRSDSYIGDGDMQRMTMRGRQDERVYSISPRDSLDDEDGESRPRLNPVGQPNASPGVNVNQHLLSPDSMRLSSSRPRQRHASSDHSLVSTPGDQTPLGYSTRPFASDRDLKTSSILSLDTVVGDRKDFKLQKVDPLFTDSNGEYAKAFTQKLANLDTTNSETDLCIEHYLVKSEKKWFDKFREARLGRHRSPAPSPNRARETTSSRSHSPVASEYHASSIGVDRDMPSSSMDEEDQFFLGEDYKPPSGLRKWIQLRLGDWPVYSFFLALGQIIAANSYQITLLTGEVGQTAEKLYVVASIYLATSILWWLVFRTFKSVVALSLPFAFYGLAFVFIGCSPFASGDARYWIQNVATGLYAAASSSGSIFFALNFGDDGGAPMKDWIFRACTIQGTQQIYVVALWYWGSTFQRQNQDGVVEQSGIKGSWRLSAITLPIAILLWAIGIILFLGLPDYYRRSPGKVPSFYKSLLRRKIVVWFFVAVTIQNFFLSAPYGRNWTFLWISKHTPDWQILLLVILFFIGIWGGILYGMSILSSHHSWVLPVFAIGLGSPRWAQIWWGTSNIGLYLPWAGTSYVSGALLSRCLWLWLGVLDALQGVGFGLILLQTLTRFHICFTLLAAQVVGSVATIAARAFAPNKIGPGPISPDISGGLDGLATVWFWLGLGFQLLICVGYFLFFRKEQLQKP